MTPPGLTSPSVAIACGGTGGHLFPGIAVAHQLARLGGCRVTLLVSPKEVDQEAVRTAADLTVVTLPAVGLTRGRAIAFVRGFVQSYRAARRHFHADPPRAVLAMGGFTSAPPILAARRCGARTFLHESNTIPGRANRWLSHFVDGAFVGFPEASHRLSARSVTVTGTPVRPQFQVADPAACRTALGLDPAHPVLLVTGGSQGAAPINRLMVRALPLLARVVPGLQLFHLTGSNDAGEVRQTCAQLGMRAVVHPFFADMHLALGAASAAVSRAGASSLAELAAVRLPAVLIPYPTAADNHQLHNARAFERTGAARLLDQIAATPETLAGLVVPLIREEAARQAMQSALAQWHAPLAAEQIADAILSAITGRRADAGARPATRVSDEPFGAGSRLEFS